MFAYVDAMIVDTPFVDRAFAENIHDAHTIEERVVRASAFREYLDSQWNSISDGDASFDWREVSTELRDDIGRVEARLGKRPTQ